MRPLRLVGLVAGVAFGLCVGCGADPAAPDGTAEAAPTGVVGPVVTVGTPGYGVGDLAVGGEGG